MTIEITDELVEQMKDALAELFNQSLGPEDALYIPSDFNGSAEDELTAALPIIKQAVQEVRAEKIRDLVSDKPENPYMYDPWDDDSIDPTNLDEVVGAAVSRGWGSGYYEGVQAVLALLEGGME